MQKKLIALAVVAAFSAPAFADTSVYGIVDAAIINTSSDATGAKSHLTVGSGGLSTSRIGVVASEDLDNGMKAIAKVEYKLDVGTADTLTSTRQEMLALAGGFGTVAAGYLQTTAYDFAVKFDPTAGSAVDALAAVNGTKFNINTSARAPHALAYISPNMSGLTVAVNRSFDVLNGGVSGPGKVTANLLSATYDAGPLAVGGVYEAVAVDGGATTTDIGLGASFDLGAAKLLGTYQTSKSDAAGASTDNAMSFSVVAPVGPGALVGSVAKNNIKSTTASDNTTAFTVAYLQSLSKTVTAYGAVERVSQDGVTKVNTTTLAVGLRKAF